MGAGVIAELVALALSGPLDRLRGDARHILGARILDKIALAHLPGFGASNHDRHGSPLMLQTGAIVFGQPAFQAVRQLPLERRLFGELPRAAG